MHVKCISQRSCFDGQTVSERVESDYEHPAEKQIIDKGTANAGDRNLGKLKTIISSEEAYKISSE